MEYTIYQEPSTLPETLTKLLNSVSTLEKRISTLELRLNHVYNYEERCRPIMDETLRGCFRTHTEEEKEDVIREVSEVVREHRRDIIISDEELARLLVRASYASSYKRYLKKLDEKRKITKLEEEVAAVSLQEEDSPSSPITEQDILEEEVHTSLDEGGPDMLPDNQLP